MKETPEIEWIYLLKNGKATLSFYVPDPELKSYLKYTCYNTLVKNECDKDDNKPTKVSSLEGLKLTMI